jgi:hypothetical protein
MNRVCTTIGEEHPTVEEVGFILCGRQWPTERGEKRWSWLRDELGSRKWRS